MFFLFGMEPTQLIAELGRDALAQRLNVSASAIKAAARRGLPASWYVVVKGMAAEMGVACPDECFNFKPSDANTSPEGSCLSPQDSGSAAETKSFPVRNNYDGGGA